LADREALPASPAEITRAAGGPSRPRAHAAGVGGAPALLLERHRGRLHATAVAVLGPGPHNEDLVHDVFLVAVRALGSRALPVWMYGDLP